MLEDGFPKDLYKDVQLIENHILNCPSKVSIGVTEEKRYFSVHDHNIIFPYRMYYLEIPATTFKEFNYQQKMILHCIYSRNDDGFIRQKYIESLLSMDFADWAIPYIVKINDEYVVEILEMTYTILKTHDTRRLKQICSENIPQMQKSYARMTSYWNEYHRKHYPNFRDYVGNKLFMECFGLTRVGTSP